jgi:hypothetical protein
MNASTHDYGDGATTSTHVIVVLVSRGSLS